MESHYDLVHSLLELLIVLGSAVGILVLCQRFRIPTVVGLLVTGVLIGPAGLGLVSEVDRVEAFAEIGVMLLLFTIGLEISAERLDQARRAFLVGGPLQAIGTGGAAFLAALAFGQPASRAVFLGFLVTLSSTAVVLKVYNDRRELRAPHGEVALGVLLFQDLLLVPMIVLTPVLGGGGEVGGSFLLLRLAAAAGAVVVAFLAARVVVPFLLHQVVHTRVREVFVLTALFLCLGMALLTERLGLSLALGAFLAGVAASRSDYHHQVMADVGPFRDVFTSLFFVSIGMLVTLPTSLSETGLVVGLAVGIIALKMVVLLAVVRALGFPRRTAVLVSFGLAQIGEFSFVLMGLGTQFGLLPAPLEGAILAAAAITLLLTPLLIHAAPAVTGVSGSAIGQAAEDGPRDHVIVIGLGHAGLVLARVLDEVAIPYVAVELSPEAVRVARTSGRTVLYGDAARPEILARAGVERARVLVSTISDPGALRRILFVARQANPHLHTIVRTRDVQELEEFSDLGADELVSLEFESSIEIFNRTLAHYHVPRNVVRAQTRMMRGEGYRMLRAATLPEGVSDTVLEALAFGTTDIYLVSSASPAAGQTLRSLDLRRRSGAMIIAVVRGDHPESNPDAEFRIEAGDHLVLVGSHAEVEAAFEILNPQHVSVRG